MAKHALVLLFVVVLIIVLYSLGLVSYPQRDAEAWVEVEALEGWEAVLP